MQDEDAPVLFLPMPIEYVPKPVAGLRVRPVTRPWRF